MDRDYFESDEVYAFYNSLYEMLDMFDEHCDLQSIREKLNIYVILKGDFIQKQVLLEIGRQIKTHHKALKAKDYSVINNLTIYDNDITQKIRSGWTKLDEKSKQKVFRRVGRMFNDYLKVKAL